MARKNDLETLFSGKPQDVEKELGIDIETFLKAITNGIWSKEHLTKYKGMYRQTSPFPVMTEKGRDGVWRFKFNPSSPCADTEFGPAYIFFDSVNLSDYGKTWALTKKELKAKEIEDGEIH